MKNCPICDRPMICSRDRLDIVIVGENEVCPTAHYSYYHSHGFTDYTVGIKKWTFCHYDDNDTVMGIVNSVQDNIELWRKKSLDSSGWPSGHRRP